VNGLAAGCIYGLVALGFVLIYKATEMVNFAQGDLLMLGAFAAFTYIGLFGLPYWLGFILAVFSAAIFGLLLDVVVLRRVIGQPQFAVVILTIGLGFIFRSIAILVWGPDIRTLPSPFANSVTNIGEIVIADVSLSIIVGTLLLSGALFAFFRYTRWGVAMQAASQNQLAAYYMGIPVKLIFSMVWGISAGVATTAGILLAPVSLIDPNIGFIAIRAFSAAVLGGFTSLPGAVVGGLIIGVIEQFSAIYLAEGVKDLAAPVVALTMLAVYPQGILGQRTRKRV
jgi:branched-chain amino acid transport system permease protein